MMLSHLMIQDAQLVTTVKDSHGDQVQTTTQEIKCRFRYITDVDRNINRESIDSQAIIWLDPSLPVEEGSVIAVEGSYWRVERLVKARTMSSTNVEFLKAFVNRHTL